MKEHLKSLKGAPIGILMFLISYVFVYLIDGEKTYILALSKLTDINALVYSIIYSAIQYVIIYEVIYLFVSFAKKYSKTITWRVMLEFLGILIALISLQVVVSVFNKNYLYEEIEVLFTGIELIILILSAVIYGIRISIDEMKINKGLENRNSKNKTED